MLSYDGIFSLLIDEGFVETVFVRVDSPFRHSVARSVCGIDNDEVREACIGVYGDERAGRVRWGPFGRDDIFDCFGLQVRCHEDGLIGSHPRVNW